MEQVIILILLGILTVVLAQQQEQRNPFTVTFDPPECCFGKPKASDFQKIGKNYYKIFSPKRKWIDALTDCALYDSQLASIDTLDELDAISTYLNGQGISEFLWVASMDQLSVGQFRWIATGQKIPKDFWKPGQPDSIGEHCVHLCPTEPTKVYRLNNLDCNHQMSFLCQKKAPKSVAVLMWP